MRNRRSFSLLEVLIVISLLAIALGTVRFGFPKLLQQEAFEKGVERVIGKLSLAQEIMIDNACDVALILRKVDGQVWCLVETDARLPQGVLKPSKIEGIHDFGFDEKQNLSELILHFEADFCRTSNGTLTLCTKDKKTTISLPGFPTRFGKGEKNYGKIKATYPKEISTS